MTADERPAPAAAGDPSSLAVRALRALQAQSAPVEAPPSADEPADEPIADTPIADEPIADEPVADEPVADEPTSAPVSVRGPVSPNEPASDSASPARPSVVRGRRRPGIAIAAVVLVAAAVFCALSALSWHRASDDGLRHAAAVRDAVLRGARVDIETVNTSDYRDPAKVLDSWSAVSTGPLADQYKANRADAISVLTKAKVTTKATVLDAAVTALDSKAAKATVIASVDVVRTPTAGAATRTRNRFQATLQRVGSSWRLSNLTIVAVQLS